MNTKGTEQILWIIEIIAVLVVSYIIVTAAQSLGSSDLTFKVNTAEEIRMMIDALISVPGDALVAYPQNVSSLTILLPGDSVRIISEEKAEGKAVDRAIALPHGYAVEGVVEHGDSFCLEKKHHKIIARECPHE